VTDDEAGQYSDAFEASEQQAQQRAAAGAAGADQRQQRREVLRYQQPRCVQTPPGQAQLLWRPAARPRSAPQQCALQQGPCARDPPAALTPQGYPPLET
jgi:hypothetical protein